MRASAPQKGDSHAHKIEATSSYRVSSEQFFGISSNFRVISFDLKFDPGGHNSRVHDRDETRGSSGFDALLVLTII